MRFKVKYTKNRYSPHRVPTPGSTESAHTLKQSILLNKQNAVFWIRDILFQILLFSSETFKPSRHQKKNIFFPSFLLITFFRNTVKRIKGTLNGFNAETDQAFYLLADPEPRSQTNEDPCELRSWSDFAVTKN